MIKIISILIINLKARGVYLVLMTDSYAKNDKELYQASEGVHRPLVFAQMCNLAPLPILQIAYYN